MKKNDLNSEGQGEGLFYSFWLSGERRLMITDNLEAALVTSVMEML